MKKFAILLLMAALLLTACQSKPVNITLNRDEQTLFDGTYTYSYTEQKFGTMHIITIIYPDGGRYEWVESSTETHSNGTYDASLYADGQQMVDAILGHVILNQPQSQRKEVSVEGIGIAILLLIAGLWEAVCPEQAWYAGHGWMFKDAEPSDFAIAMFRASGIIEIVVAIIIGIAAIAGF